MSESLGITVQTMCYQCQALTELCPDCQEAKDVRDISMAHRIVDESDDYYISTFQGVVLKAIPNYQVANGGSIAEPRPLSFTRDAESGHDWVGSVTKLTRPFRQQDGTLIEERYEFLDPISIITDRIFDLETSLTVTQSEVICQSCHLIYNKHQEACPICY